MLPVPLNLGKLFLAFGKFTEKLQKNGKIKANSWLGMAP